MCSAVAITQSELKTYIPLGIEIKQLRKELSDIYSEYGPKGSINHLGGIRGGKISDLSDEVIRLQELSLVLQDTISRLSEERRRLETAMDVLAPEERMVTRMRYFKGMGMVQIRLSLGISERWVYVLHSRALDKLSQV